MIETILLFATLSLAFFLPGWLLLRLWLGKQFSYLEESIYAFALGLTLANFLLLVLNHFGVALSSITLATSFILINAALGGWYYSQRSGIPNTPPSPSPNTHQLSPTTWLVLTVMLALTIVIKAYYLIPAGLPTATDMGHHMYWSQYIVEKESLPVYQKIEVASDPTTGAIAVIPPKPIADFIIGEHIPFALVALLSGLSIIGSFPVLLLLIINLFSLLAILALTLRLGHNLWNERERSLFVVGTFLFLGPLFAIASPQAKFVSGGVVGNLFGNFFIPLILLALYLGLREAKPRLVALGLLLLVTLAYTHHLSTLILGFIIIGIVVIACLGVARNFWPTFRGWLFTFLKPSVGIVIGGILFFATFIALPSYLDREAIDSAIGSPVKTTRTGLTFLQVSNSIGITKMALAIAGFVLLLVTHRRFRVDPLTFALVLGWGGMLTIMAIAPNLVFLDIPSNRVGSYLVYPTALLAGLAFMYLFQALSGARSKALVASLGSLLIMVIVANGVFENGASLIDKSKATEAQEVFTATRYLSERMTTSDMILKDHNYLAADAWMKLFFVRDYGYPLSRGLFSRYEETGSRRERCTLVMIASPNSPEAKQCFTATGTNYIVVNPTFDAIQFEKSPDFTKVYVSDHVVVFKRKE